MDTTPQNRPMYGIFWMLVSGFCFVGVTALVKSLGPRLPAAEAAFLRYAFGIIFLLPVLVKMRMSDLTRRQMGLSAVRGVLHSLGVILWFFAMTRISIAEVTAMNYLAPIYVSLGAALFFGERLAARRIIAVLMGLLGTVIILRPGFRELEAGHFAMLFVAVVFAGSYLLAKLLADELKPAVVVVSMSVFVTIGLAPFAIPVWITPTLNELMILAAVALLATFAHYAMTLAFAAAPLTVTQPVTFLQLVWATLLGALVFSEPVDIWVVIGGAVILGSVSFITWREAFLKRQITPNTNATKL